MSARAARYRRSPSALSRAIGDEILICLPDWEEVDRLSASGAAIWRRLAEPRTLYELTTDVAQTYSVRAADVRADVRRFVALLVERGLAQHIPDEQPKGNGDRAVGLSGKARRQTRRNGR